MALEYRPLDRARNELRVLSFNRPIEGKPIHCTLEHVSLDSYSNHYGEFLQRIGEGVTKRDRDYLWDSFTNPNMTKQQIENILQTGLVKPWPPFLKRLALVDRYRSHSLKSAFGNERFRNARRYSWGDFYALSYEWGDLSLQEEIIINGVETTVTKNLDAALRGIGSWWHNVWGDDGTVRLWIDAICINQKDHAERSSEIKRMGTIYSDALAVLSWLGPALEPQQQRETPGLVRCIARDVIQKHARLGDAIQARYHPACKPAWRGMLELAARSYWTRMWIVQEVVLGNTTSRICFGSEHLLTSLYLHILRNLGFAEDYAQTVMGSFDMSVDSDLEEYLQWHSLIKQTEIFMKLGGYQHRKLPHPPLLTVLSIGRKCKQLDARDKVYGILGLVDARVRQVIDADYNKPVLEVFLDFAEAVITCTGNLEILLQGAVDHQRMVNKLVPSWCPCPTLYWDPPIYEDLNSTTIGAWQQEFYSRFRAAGDSLHVFRRTAGRGNLLCRGFLLDIIDGLGCSPLYADITHEQHDRVPGGLDPPLPATGREPSETPAKQSSRDNLDGNSRSTRKRHLHGSNETQPQLATPGRVTNEWTWPPSIGRPRRSKSQIRGRDAIRHALWNTLSIDFQFNHSRNEWVLQRKAIKYLDSLPWLPDTAAQTAPFFALYRFQRCNADLVVCGMRLRDLFSPDNSKFSLDASPFEKVMAAVGSRVNSRRFMTTESGRLVLGPAASRKGEKIFILLGCHLPLILRPKPDGTYTVFGECYVHGMMKGEAMNINQSCLMDIVLS